MKPSKAIKPISYLKAHASEIIREITKNHATMIITHNGEAKVVLQDINVFEKMQDSLALLKILAMSSQSMKAGRKKTIDRAFIDFKKRIKDS